MKQDRGLVIILGLIALLIVVSLVLFFVRQDDQQTYKSENMPDFSLAPMIIYVEVKESDKNGRFSFIQRKGR